MEVREAAKGIVMPWDLHLLVIYLEMKRIIEWDLSQEPQILIQTSAFPQIRLKSASQRSFPSLP